MRAELKNSENRQVEESVDILAELFVRLIDEATQKDADTIQKTEA
jgi:hypothetical protein